jgi:TonB family protein
MLWRCLISAVVLAVMIGSSTAAPRGASRFSDHGTVEVQSSKEFQAQVAAIIEAYRKHDAARGRQFIEQFRLPNAPDWFAAHLNPARSEEFASRYDRLFTSFADSFEHTVRDIVADKGADLDTQVKAADEKPTEDLQFGGKRSGVVTTQPVDLFFCMFQITIKKAPVTGWGSTFVQQDGAFRFAGFGGWPFWVWQDHTEGWAPPDGYFLIPFVLKYRVDPIYPREAKANRIQGTVVLHIRVDKEGRVEKAEVLSGDPLLSQAALDAVRQWRYKPAVRSGVAVAHDGTAHVVFQLN